MLNKRVEALERVSPTVPTGPMFIHVVAMDSKDNEIQRIAKGGQEWVRKPVETEQELKDRAIREVIQPLAGCSSVFLCY